MEISHLEIALRLFLAVIMGGLVGLEREVLNRPAGFRTHILVCVGAALIMMVSAYGFIDFGGRFEMDPARIAAQVITGVGFLGAGTIIQQRGNIQGLTTAASIWVVSGIGLAVGIGFYEGAALAMFFVLVSLILFSRIDDALLSRRRYKKLWIRAIDRTGLMGKIAGILGELQINIRKIELTPLEYSDEEQADLIIMDFLLRAPVNLESSQLFRRLALIPGILEVHWQGEEIPMNYYASSSQSFK